MEKKHGKASAKAISRRAFVAGSAAAGASLLVNLPGSLAGAAEEAPVIPRRGFGRTGIDVPVVGMGGGSRFYEPISDDEQAAELVKETIDRGIDYLETSANYGPSGASERRIGLAMKTHRSRVFLETKVDARDYDGAMREMERSLDRMKTDRLDLVLHHFLRTGEELQQISSQGGAERAIRKLVEEKSVRFRGFSCHDPELTLTALERLTPDAIQLPINAVRNPDFEARVLPAAASRGVGVIAMKTCGHGYFFRDNATRPDRIERFGPPAEAWNRSDLPTPEAYLHYALSLPVAIAVVGMDSKATLERVIRAAARFSSLTREQMESISRRAQVFRTTGYWVPRA